MSISGTFKQLHPKSWDIVTILAAAVLYLACIRFILPKNKRLPPGPQGIPFLGSLQLIPRPHQFKTFTEWGSIYGDVVYARLCRKHFVILNSLRAAQDLMEKRGAIYSDRPELVLLNNIYEWKPILSILPFGDDWRHQRRWMQDVLQTRNVLLSYRPLQRSGVDKLIARLAISPGSFLNHIKRYASNFTLEVGYSLDESFAEDKFTPIAEESMEAIFQSGSFVASSLDFFPFFQYIPGWTPGVGSKRRASHIRGAIRQMMKLPFDTVRKNSNSGTSRPCFATSLIDEKFNGRMTAHEEELVKGATSTLWIAGAETASLVLTTFILAMLVHPDVFKRLQEEIDTVTGGERLPEFEDRKDMPYLECVLMEVYRWNPPLPLGIYSNSCVSHRLIQDDVYRDYFIPRGSTIVPNTWAMSRDPTIYSDPDAFRPERFEGMDPTALNSADPKKYVFGFGRRICSGRAVADLNFWLAAASIAATMNICKATDAAGNEIEPIVSFITGSTSFPRKFACNIHPRSSLAAELAAQMNLTEYHS
ncbi:hypothetical protein IEO21_08237 [Rhodonia placenta]|uniref:Cytochrome P450 n=1 Tax=Rhodonia placenta TaxID=104341 RepID=A0A8H7NWZ1_9APHY|nr:hypothetical protein IEO21_08237 [Postia placenta]